MEKKLFKKLGNSVPRRQKIEKTSPKAGIKLQMQKTVKK